MYSPTSLDSAAEMAFRDELLKNERIVWAGQPDPRVIFSKADIFLVPFSLMWGGFAIFWELMALGVCSDISAAPSGFALFGIPFVLVGLYMIFGRFIYKAYRKRRTYYAITNRRALVLAGGRGRSLEAVYIDAIPTLNKSVGKNGIGNLTFGNYSGFTGMYANTGMEFFGSMYGQPPPAFHDIRGAEEVYELVNRLRNEME